MNFAVMELMMMSEKWEKKTFMRKFEMCTKLINGHFLLSFTIFFLKKESFRHTVSQDEAKTSSFDPSRSDSLAKKDSFL